MPECIELRRQRPERMDPRRVLLVAGQRRLAIEALMRAAVIDLLQPSPQARVEIIETQDLAFIDLAEKLSAAGTVPAFELPLALRRVGPAMDQHDAQTGQMPCRVCAT